MAPQSSRLGPKGGAGGLYLFREPKVSPQSDERGEEDERGLHHWDLLLLRYRKQQFLSN
jgi:hypothetical protein